MILSVYAQAAEPRIIQLWVGLFGIDEPSPLTFRIDGNDVTPLGSPVISPIRDRVTGPNGQPLNHRGVFRFEVLEVGRTYRIEIAVDRKTKGLAYSVFAAAQPTIC